MVNTSPEVRVTAEPKSYQPISGPPEAVELYKTRYWNGPTEPEAVNVGFPTMSLYVPLLWVEEVVVRFLDEIFVYETWVMFAMTLFVATGMVFVSAIVS